MGSVVNGVGKALGGLAGGGQNEFLAKAPDIMGPDFEGRIMSSENQYYGNIANQQGLASALQDQMNGGGPNLAQLQLQDATNRNIQQGAGMIASQKGVNPALAARLVAQNTAQNNQQAAMQAAQLRMQQQLAAQQQLAGVYQGIGQQNLGAQQILHNSADNQYSLANHGQLAAQQINAGVAQQNAQQNSNVLGNVLGAGASLATGGLSSLAGPAAKVASPYVAPTTSEMFPPIPKAQGGYIPGKSDYAGDDERNDKVHALLSPGEIVIPKSKAKDPKKAKEFIDQLMENKDGSYTQVLQAHQNLKRANEEYEKATKMAEGGEVEAPSFAASIGNWFGGQPTQSAPPIPMAPPQQPVQQPVENVPVVNQPAKMPKELQGIYGEEQKAIKGQEAAQVMQSKGAEKAYDQYSQNIANTVNDMNQKKEDVMKEYQSNLNDYASGKIDPNRIWHNSSTGQKVAASIGIILGGIGAGLSRGPNQALEVLNDQVNKDIEAQKLEMGKKQNLLSLNMQKYKNLQDAELKTKIDYATALQAQLAKVAAQSGSQQALASGHAMQAVLQEKIMNWSSQIGQANALKKLAGGDSNGVNMEALPPEARERTVTLPNGGVGLARTKEQATETNKALNVLNELDSAVGRAEKFSSDNGRTVGMHIPVVGDIGTSSYKEGMSIKHDIETSMNKLQGLNRLTDTEMKKFEQMVSDPGAWNKETVSKLTSFLKDKIKEKQDSEMSQYVEGHKTGAMDKYKKKMGPPVIN